MKIYPAIDLVGGQAVRLLRGDYQKMTVYSAQPEKVALDFYEKGARAAHLVDLEGARDGGTPNLAAVERIVRAAPLKCEIGGGVRSLDVIERYLAIGVDRVILGTAAVETPGFVVEAVSRFGAERIVIGADLKDGEIAVRGWTASAKLPLSAFLRQMGDIGVKYLIATDISRDGAMRGTNRELYQQLQEEYAFCVTASGGVSTLADIRALREMALWGAIIGKAYYTGDIDLSRAIEAAK